MRHRDSFAPVSLSKIPARTSPSTVSSARGLFSLYNTIDFVVDGFGYVDGFCIVLFPLVSASLFTVIVYGIGLLQRKAESAQVTNRHCIRVKSKGLVSAWSISGSQLLCSFRMFPLALFIAVVLRDI